jgi:hypothetical protein
MIYRFLSLALGIIILITGCKKNDGIVQTTAVQDQYPVHKNITVTYFYVGEPATANNDYIPNNMSSWDGKWEEHYGGVDDPDNRNGYYPAGFTPKENPFYFALPYNDFDSTGRKQSAYDLIYWAKEKTWASNESMCKNQWIKIINGNKVAYAQWEDCGPYYYDDSNYVFGNAQPMNQVKNHSSGLDVSPAVRDYLGFTGLDTASWQFVNETDVPDGPWKIIITTSQVSY